MAARLGILIAAGVDRKNTRDRVWMYAIREHQTIAKRHRSTADRLLEVEDPTRSLDRKSVVWPGNLVHSC